MPQQGQYINGEFVLPTATDPRGNILNPSPGYWTGNTFNPPPMNAPATVRRDLFGPVTAPDPSAGVPVLSPTGMAEMLSETSMSGATGFGSDIDQYGWNVAATPGNVARAAGIATGVVTQPASMLMGLPSLFDVDFGKVAKEIGKSFTDLFGLNEAEAPTGPPATSWDIPDPYSAPAVSGGQTAEAPPDPATWDIPDPYSAPGVSEFGFDDFGGPGDEDDDAGLGGEDV